MNDNLYQDSVSQSPLLPQQISNNGEYVDGLFVFFQSLILFLFVVALFFGVLLVLWHVISKRIHRKRHDAKVLNDWQKTIVLEITVPRESPEQAQKDSGNTKREDKDFIAMGEQIYTIMHDYAKGGPRDWFKGGERFSMEIICHQKQIVFWLVCNEYVANVLESQIFAAYPKSHITRIEDANIFKGDVIMSAQELELANRFELPFKTYRDMDGDPLNTLTNAMTGLAEDEIAAIQLILTPINDKWQNKSRELAAKIQQGQNPSQILEPKKKSLLEKFWKFINISFDKIVLGDKKENEKPKKRKIDLTGEEIAINLTPQQQEYIKKLEQKASKPGFTFSLRVVSAAKTEARATQIIDTIVPTFQIFDMRPINWLRRKKKFSVSESVTNFLLRAPDANASQIITSEEAVSIWHIPGHLVQTPNIKWLLARKPPIPINLPEEKPDSIFLGIASARGQERKVYMNMEDRFRHMYSIGGSGSGKTYLMTSAMIQDIRAGRGVCFVDPHGQAVDELMEFIPPERYDDVIVFAPSITDRPLGLNMLEFNPAKPQEKTVVIETLFSIWDKLYNLKNTGGPMFEMYMKNSMRLVMGHPESGSTLMEISKVLTDEDYRSYKLALCPEPEVVDFWEKEATKARGEAALENIVPYITSKLSPFITNDFIRPMIGQQKSAINWREAIDNRKIVLVKLEKGLITEQSAYIIGMVIIGGLFLAGMGRTDGLKYNLDGTTTRISPHEIEPFFVYIDEMQNFLFEAIPKALEEIRKFKVSFYLAHQFVKQVVSQGDERIKDSIMANCGSKFIFRVNADDAEYLEKEFGPTLTAQDLMTPEAFTCNTILLANGTKTQPFNFKPAPWPSDRNRDNIELLINMTKQKYGRDRAEVEKEIRDRAKLFF